MNLELRRNSPVPLYHQIAEGLRNAIAVGTLAPGASLPPVRVAAVQWGVNLHTARRSYAELAAEGLLIMDRRGTRVAPREEPSASGSSVDDFIAAFARKAAERFGLTQIQLGQLLLKRASAAKPVPVHFLECSLGQAKGHCEEIMRAWQVDAKPLVLAGQKELPHGVVISTYFHYNDIRQRWPERIDEIRFVAIAPDPAVAASLEADRGARHLLVCELEESKAVNIAADLRALLPAGRYTIEPYVLNSPSSIPHRTEEHRLLVAPRVWGAMDEHARRHVIPIRYCLRGYEVDSLGESFGWRPSSTHQAVA